MFVVLRLSAQDKEKESGSPIFHQLRGRREDTEEKEKFLFRGYQVQVLKRREEKRREI